MNAPAHKLSDPQDPLPFVLPDFTRLTWVNDQAKELWGTRFSKIIRAWQEIEWRSVAAGLRPCALVRLTPNQYIQSAAQWAHFGLGSLPLSMEAAGNQPYSTTPRASSPGQPFVYSIVLGGISSLTSFKQAWDDGDNSGIGTLLGFPACCRRFFEEEWIQRQSVDTTWAMAFNSQTEQPTSDQTHLRVSGPYHSNILWRWMGVRAVTHLPCSFHCEESAVLGREFMRIGRQLGYEEEMAWMEDILNWPISWSALHGIAEIKTPVVKVSTRTNATGSEYRVEWEGTTYPEEGATGLVFPYKLKTRAKISGSNSFQRGLSHHIQPGSQHRPAWFHTDNGFSSRRGMDTLHAPIVAMAEKLLAETPGAVLDLGCGNGALLQKICTSKDRIPFGTDLNPGCIQHAHQLFPELTDHFVACDLFEHQSWPQTDIFRLALLMPGRLQEAGPAKAASLLQTLRQKTRGILFYMYPDWSERELVGLLADLNLPPSITPKTMPGETQVAYLPTRGIAV